MGSIFGRFRAFAKKENLSGSCFVVGGTVRDILLGVKAPADIDIAIKGDATGVAKRFAREAGGSFILLDERFGMARVVVGREHIDFSALRGEGIEEDLADRDITINAMAMPVASRRLIDPLNGADDLLSGRLIRMVSEKNLTDDPLRVLRCYRFSGMPGFRLDQKTAHALRRLAPLLKRPAAERVTGELRHILLAPDSMRVLKRMREGGALRIIMPGLREEDKNISALGTLEGVFMGRFPFHEELGHLVEGQLFVLKLAVLARGAGARALVRLRLSGKEQRLINGIFVYQRRLEGLFKKKAGEAALVRALRDSKDDIYIYLLSACALLCRREKRKSFIEFSKGLLSLYLRQVRPRLSGRLITGDDLKREFALPPSPLFRDVLGKVELMWLRGKINTKGEALREAARLLHRPPPG